MNTTNDVANLAELVNLVRMSTNFSSEKTPFFDTWYTVPIDRSFLLITRSSGDKIDVRTTSGNVTSFRSQMLADTIRAKFQ